MKYKMYLFLSFKVLNWHYSCHIVILVPFQLPDQSNLDRFFLQKLGTESLQSLLYCEMFWNFFYPNPFRFLFCAILAILLHHVTELLEGPKVGVAFRVRFPYNEINLHHHNTHLAGQSDMVLSRLLEKSYMIVMNKIEARQNQIGGRPAGASLRLLG